MNLPDAKPVHPRIVLSALGMVPSSGGTTQAVRNFQKALAADVVSFTDAALLAAEGSALSGAVQVPVGRFPGVRQYLWAGARARREADRLAAGADLLVCNVLYRYHTHWVKGWARRRGIPYWVVPHGCLDPHSYTYRPTIKRVWMAGYGRGFLAGASHVIFSTQRERRKAAAFYDGANGRVVNWPVAALDMTNADSQREQMRRRLGLGKNDRLLLFLGRLHEIKRPLEIVAAVAAAGAGNVHLAVVGPDETITASQVLAAGERLGLQGRLHVPGAAYGEAKLEWMHASDGSICLSWMESFGLSVAEALSAGKPVILSPGVDLGEELKPLGCGWFLPDDHLETAAAAIREWAQVPEAELRERGGRGRDFVLRELTFERFTSKLRALVDEALASRKSGPAQSGGGG
ncbi:MAG: glycosyltransferase [Opitutales bacterium]|jgi:glycosyltransferase involved in cell wall biosynthesis